MTVHRSHAVALPLTVLLGQVGPAIAQDRIYVDQHSPVRSELIVANADGQHPHKLVPGAEFDYNASFSFDGQWVVFTSERAGSADIYRARADGIGVERLTDSPAFDDQGALSPDNRSLAFVSSRGDGSTDIYVLDLASREVRNLTHFPGGDFRPSWSPDGRTLAFTSDRGAGFPHQPNGWEHLHATNVYLIGADGTGLKQLTSNPDVAAGSPTWSADGKQVVFYELPVKDTYAVRRRDVATTIVSIDLATGARAVRVSGTGHKLSPHFVGHDRIAYLAKSGDSAALAFSGSETGPFRDIWSPSWSRDGTRVVYQADQLETMQHHSRPPGAPLLGRDPKINLRYASGFPAISPDGRSIVVSEREPTTDEDRSSLVVWNIDGSNPRRIFHHERNAMGLSWSRDGNSIAFGAGAFFGARASEPARIMTIAPDGSNARTVTKGTGNAGFPSWSPDGTQIVYRFWTGTGAGGLRIVTVATGEVRTLTTEYDTLPSWSPTGSRIVFNRYAPDARFRYDEFDIYAIRPDGGALERLTDAEGNDAHPFWSPDGRFILWSSSRFGFKDEAALTLAPQPYAELFIMNADGSDQRPLTDNQYEEGTPAWLPPVLMK